MIHTGRSPLARNLRPPRSIARAALLASAAMIVLAGCDDEFPGKPKVADRPVAEEQSLNFNLLFGQHCAGCHGADGARGPAPPLNDALFLAIVPNEELRRTIQAGRPGTPMPAFAHDRGGSLSEAQVGVLAAGIKTRWSWTPAAGAIRDLPEYAPAKGAEAPVAVNPGSTAPKNAIVTFQPEAAAIAFARACAHCHGADGRGSKSKGGAGAINDPAFLSLISDQALRRIIITGRPDLKMPSFAGPEGRAAGFQPLSAVEIDQLVTLLSRWRQGGQVEAVAPNPESGERKN